MKTVRVLHLMQISEVRQHRPIQLGSSLSALDLESFFTPEAEIWCTEDNGYDGVIEREIAIKSSGSWHTMPLFSGEFACSRALECDEVFESSNALLILRSDEIIFVPPGSLAFDHFTGRHGETFGDAGMEAFNAAFELLLRELGADYELCHACAWPDELPDAIVSALRGMDYLRMTKDAVLSLCTQIIADVEAATLQNE